MDVFLSLGDPGRQNGTCGVGAQSSPALPIMGESRGTIVHDNFLSRSAMAEEKLIFWPH